MPNETEPKTNFNTFHPLLKNKEIIFQFGMTEEISSIAVKTGATI